MSGNNSKIQLLRMKCSFHYCTTISQNTESNTVVQGNRIKEN
jgi:hypothetical protein